MSMPSGLAPCRCLVFRMKLGVAAIVAQGLCSPGTTIVRSSSFLPFDYHIRKVIESAQEQTPCRYSSGDDIAVAIGQDPMSAGLGIAPHPTLTGFVLDRGGVILSRAASQPTARTDVDNAHRGHGPRMMCAPVVSEIARSKRRILRLHAPAPDGILAPEGQSFVREVTRLLEHPDALLDYGEPASDRAPPLLTIDTRPTSVPEAMRGVRVELFSGFRVRCSVGLGRNRWWASLIPHHTLVRRLESLQIDSSRKWSDLQACVLLLTWTAITVPECRDDRGDIEAVCSNALVAHGELQRDWRGMQ